MPHTSERLKCVQTLQITNLAPKSFNPGGCKMFCGLRSLLLLVLTIKCEVLLSLPFQKNSQFVFHTRAVRRGSGVCWKVGSGGRIVSATLKLENRQHPQRLTAGFPGFCRSREASPHAAAPLASQQRPRSLCPAQNSHLHFGKPQQCCSSLVRPPSALNCPASVPHGGGWATLESN